MKALNYRIAYLTFSSVLQINSPMCYKGTMTVPIKEKKKNGAQPGNKFAVDHGRPKVEIDWKRVDELLMADCSGSAIADTLGISRFTLYDRCLVDKGIPFSSYCQQMNIKGESLLREVQYLKAMGGDNALLIWLGKCRLKQTDAKMTISLEGDHPIAQLINQAAGYSKDLVKNDDEPNSESSK